MGCPTETDAPGCPKTNDLELRGDSTSPEFRGIESDRGGVAGDGSLNPAHHVSHRR